MVSDLCGDVCIIGAGLVGSILACILQKKGFQVTVYERYADMTTVPSLGRSINLVMTRRGLKAAELLGLKQVLVDELGVKVMGRMMWQTNGSSMFQKYGRDSDCNYSVSRYDLNCFFVKRAVESGVKIVWNTMLVGIYIYIYCKTFNILRDV